MADSVMIPDIGHHIKNSKRSLVNFKAIRGIIIIKSEIREMDAWLKAVDKRGEIYGTGK